MKRPLLLSTLLIGVATVAGTAVWHLRPAAKPPTAISPSRRSLATVARVMALGSGTLELMASCSHLSNCFRGSACDASSLSSARS